MYRRILLVVTALLLSDVSKRGCDGIEFTSSDEAFVAIENGTAEVILDCPYDLGDEDTDGFVLKWFYGDENTQFFQWIPDLGTPQAVMFNEFLDLEYEFSDSPLHKHRALRFVNPTIELHGRYSCRVSTYFDEKTHSVNLIVYTLPSALTLMVDDTDAGNVSVKCVSEPSFPEPQMELSLVNGDEVIQLEADEETEREMNLFNTSLTAFVDGDSVAVAPVVEFQCSLSIPHTSLSVTEGLKYRSDGLLIYDAGGYETTVPEYSEIDVEEEVADGGDDDDDTEVEVHISASTDRGGVPSSSTRKHWSVATALLSGVLCIVAF